MFYRPKSGCCLRTSTKRRFAGKVGALPGARQRPRGGSHTDRQPPCGVCRSYLQVGRDAVRFAVLCERVWRGGLCCGRLRGVREGEAGAVLLWRAVRTWPPGLQEGSWPRLRGSWQRWLLSGGCTDSRHPGATPHGMFRVRACVRACVPACVPARAHAGLRLVWARAIKHLKMAEVYLCDQTQH